MVNRAEISTMGKPSNNDIGTSKLLPLQNLNEIIDRNFINEFAYQ
jgi:hypothetical protein